MTSMVGETSAPARGIFGHPKGLYYLAATEAWERFSYYGMTALVVLYMVNQLLLPGHVENIAGFAAFRATLEGVFGPMSTQALASQIFGLYSGFVYFTPVLGGWIADRFLGQRNAVVAGAVLMSAGHLAMAFDRSFLGALALLIFGSGLLKGNIAAQVGGLYPVDDEASRVRGYAIFSMGINVGATLGPIVCGLLAQLYGWHVGFGTAAVFILIGLGTYLAGYRHLPSRVERAASASRTLTPGERRRIAAICAVLAIVVFPATSYFQCFNTAAIWTQDHVNRDLGGFAIPVPWFQAVDPIFSILGVPVVFALWRWQAEARAGVEPGDLDKIGMGAWLVAGGNLILVAAVGASGNDGLSPIWPFLYYVMMGFSFLFYWPVTLALVSRGAPAPVNATMMGVAYLTLFVASNFMGRLGGLYETLSPAMFWGLHAAIAAAGGLAVLVFGPAITRGLRIDTAASVIRTTDRHPNVLLASDQER
jgi:POT family proton-dependent oligopeptide transporter